ncbi:polyphosphate kinase 2 [Mesorhizobium sp. M2A.F.Ca.ET.042.01.1.1]|uniref:polyphosphate kinase 2 n=1 Tax=Mesorhizobium sp. M2A.F.Ca.ET.042.01.1.1 TaxID=2496745 RepID=UPI000FCBBE04|nr:polyphosphate kinase 2 [Mesorhizobium sp. M2A.F.Ca.ET.042.01.1.1]RUX34855.1 polyphosphate kinase 2 [Mesorhizobium sp. M2A.F.Ca.ET.042.01.1.1]
MKKAKETAEAVPATAPIKIKIGGKEREFDVDNPVLPDWIVDNKLTAGGYPYDKKMKDEDYEKELEGLQIELVKAQAWLQATGKRVMALFEGRDAAGKGGTIFVLRQYMNPRTARNVALPKPTSTETGQWYYQRYVDHFPTSGEFVTFDRSWYNRAGVEPVMGFCTPEQQEKFLDETPHFERMICNEGIHFFKFWLDIGRETQLERFHDRRWSPLKNWKFSPMDIAGVSKWDDYTKARDKMIKRTHKEFSPWIIVRANDKRRARLAVIQRILLSLPYDGRDLGVIGKPDKKIIGEGPAFLKD